MLKRILSVILTLSMALSMLCVSSVSASAPIKLDGATQVMFDQSFGGFSSAADVSDFNVSGSNWYYAPNHMILKDRVAGSIITKNNIDVSDAKSWEFTSSQLMVDNCVYWYLGFDGAKGYILKYSQKNKTLSLYKDVAVSNMADATPVKEISAGNYYESPYVVTVTYDDGVFTVYIQTNSVQKKAMLTYEETEKTAVCGKWGIYNGKYDTKNLTVFNMSLKKTYDSITVDQWKYDKTFTAANTQAELEADGFTFSKTTTPGNSGLLYQNKTFTFGPNGKDISGDYYFETKVTRSYNTYTLDFNHSSKGYYRIWYGVGDSNADKNKPWIRLQKYDAEAASTYTLVEIAKSGIASGITRTYKGTVKTLEDGSADIKIEIYNGETLEATLSYVDTATDKITVTQTVETVTDKPVVDENGNPVYEDDGVTPKTEEVVTTTTTTEEKDTGAPLTSGKLRLISNSSGSNSYMKYLKIYSLGESSAGNQVTYSKTVVDKTFSSADNSTTATDEGFKLGGYSSSEDAYGLRFSSGKLSASYIYYNTKISGDYEFYTNLYRKTNGYTLYFNRTDDKNCYSLTIYYKSDGLSNNKYRLEKTVGGKTTVLDEKVVTTTAYKDDLGHAGSLDITISVDKDDQTGALDINVITQKGTRTPLTLSYRDESPLPEGYCRVAYNYTSSGCKKFRITQFETITEGGSDGIPEFTGKFLNDSGEIKDLSKGNIYFEYPTTMLGNYKAVAALYEDYKMTAVKVIEPFDLYMGKVKLFDTSSSTAENMKIRVFFLDGDDNLKIVADEIYEIQ